jgi:hypothetical protein
LYERFATFDEEQAANAVKYIAQHANGNKPFFMDVNFLKMHNPTNAAPDLAGKSHLGDNAFRAYIGQVLAPELSTGGVVIMNNLLVALGPEKAFTQSGRIFETNLARQSREGLAASVDLHPIRTLAEQHEHGVRGPPNVAAPREFAIERDRRDDETDQA